MRSAGRGFSGGGTLTEGWISRASADQRRGRAGRVGPGVCFRMYSRETYESTFDARSSPEISRIDLDGLILRVKSIAGDDVDPRRFPWLEPPPSEAIERATWRLRQHGALRADERLTPLGAFLASLPVDAAVGKLLALGSVLGLAGPIATIAAALSTRAPVARGFGPGADAAERSARAPFESPHGDPFTRLVAFARWARARDDPRADARKWCRRGTRRTQAHRDREAPETVQGRRARVGAARNRQHERFRVGGGSAVRRGWRGRGRGRGGGRGRGPGGGGPGPGLVAGTVRTRVARNGVCDISSVVASASADRASSRWTRTATSWTNRPTTTTTPTATPIAKPPPEPQPEPEPGRIALPADATIVVARTRRRTRRFVVWTSRRTSISARRAATPATTANYRPATSISPRRFSRCRCTRMRRFPTRETPRFATRTRVFTPRTRATRRSTRRPPSRTPTTRPSSARLCSSRNRWSVADVPVRLRARPRARVVIIGVARGVRRDGRSRARRSVVSAHGEDAGGRRGALARGVQASTRDARAVAAKAATRGARRAESDRGGSRRPTARARGRRRRRRISRPRRRHHRRRDRASRRG